MPRQPRLRLPSLIKERIGRTLRLLNPLVTLDFHFTDGIEGIPTLKEFGHLIGVNQPICIPHVEMHAGNVSANFLSWFAETGSGIGFKITDPIRPFFPREEVVEIIAPITV